MYQQPPSVFRVLDQKFTVTVVDRDTALFNGSPSSAVGATNVDEQYVQLRCTGPGGVSEHQQVDTLLHEVIHSIIYTAGLRAPLFDRDTDQEEELVGALAPQLLVFLRNNPQIVSYLLQPLP